MITWLSTTSLTLVKGASRIIASVTDPANKEDKAQSGLRLWLWIDECLDPPCCCSFAAVFIATLQAYKEVLQVCDSVFSGRPCRRGELKRNWPGAERVPPQTGEPPLVACLYPLVQVEGVTGDPGFAGLPGWVSKPWKGKMSDLNAARENSHSSEKSILPL